MATNTTALSEDTRAMRAARAEIDRLQAAIGRQQAAIGRQQALLLRYAARISSQQDLIVALRAGLERLAALAGEGANDGG